LLSSRVHTTSRIGKLKSKVAKRVKRRDERWQLRRL
jgi:hypothetical protein